MLTYPAGLEGYILISLSRHLCLGAALNRPVSQSICADSYEPLLLGKLFKISYNFVMRFVVYRQTGTPTCKVSEYDKEMPQTRTADQLMVL